MVEDFNIQKETEETVIREVSYRKIFCFDGSQKCSKRPINFFRSSSMPWIFQNSTGKQILML